MSREVLIKVTVNEVDGEGDEGEGGLLLEKHRTEESVGEAEAEEAEDEDNRKLL